MSFCDIHKVKRRENYWESFKNYLAILIWVVIVLAITISVISRFDKEAFYYKLVFYLAMFALVFIVLFSIYVVIPNIRLKFKHVLYPAIFASAILALLQFFFRFILGTLMNFDIFGQFIIVPVLLFWLYIVWSVVIWGVKFSEVLYKYDKNRHDKIGSEKYSPDKETDSKRIANSLGQFIFQLLSEDGKKFPLEYPLISKEEIINIPEPKLMNDLLEHLEAKNMIEYIRTNLDNKNKSFKHKYRLKTRDLSAFIQTCEEYIQSS